MAAGLYNSDAVFTEAMNAAFAAMGTEGPRIRDTWLGGDPLDRIEIAQPLLLAVGYALGSMVESWRAPAALLGHSMGEVAAAALAGVFSLRDAMHVVLERLRRHSEAPPGGMLAVMANPGQVAGVLNDDVVIGAVNAPGQLILSGPRGPLAEAERALRSGGVACLMLASPYGFHSPSMAPAVTAAMDLYEQVSLRPPRLTIFSAYTCGPLDDRTATNPGFWAAQPTQRVHFWPTLEALLATDHLLIDVSPGQSLGLLARRHPAVASGGSEVIALFPSRTSDERASVGAARDRIRIS